MFTGIVKGIFPVREVKREPQMLRYGVELSDELLQGLERGASVAVDGVCQTVVAIKSKIVCFDAIQETLDRSTIRFLEEGRGVNIERAAKVGDEIGGHMVAGHVYGMARLEKVEVRGEGAVFTLSCEPSWMKYFFSKGFIALDGVSLTLVDVFPEGRFTVHLIPETLRITTLGKKTVGQWLNVEFDPQTQTIVETVERVLASRK